MKTIPQTIQYVSFGCDKDGALEWRKDHGGWIFETDRGAIFWFNNRFTPSTIIAHPALTGYSGKLI